MRRLTKLLHTPIFPPSAVEILTFTRHLSIMLRSGIPLDEAFGILSSESSSGNLAPVLRSIADSIANGRSLSSALASHRQAFSPFYRQLVEVGEETGNLETNLAYLAEYLRKQREFSNKVHGALLYPSFVLLLALASMLGLSLFVLPQLVDLFASMETELPLSTTILLAIAKYMRDFGVLSVLVASGILVLLRFGVRLPSVQPVWHRLLLSFPVLGTFLQHVELTILSRNLGIMLQSGIPLLQALQTQAASTRNTVYKQHLLTFAKAMESGKSFHDVFTTQKHAFFPPLAVRMLTIGETSGKLDESFTYLSEYFEEEVSNATKDITALLEPIILIFVGLVVAFIALAIVTPIYQFTDTIQR